MVRKRLPRIGLGTLCRNLELMADSGMILKIEVGGTQKRFDATTDDHYHIRCSVCGRVDDIDVPVIRDLASGRPPPRRTRSSATTSNSPASAAVARKRATLDRGTLGIAPLRPPTAKRRPPGREGAFLAAVVSWPWSDSADRSGKSTRQNFRLPTQATRCPGRVRWRCCPPPCRRVDGHRRLLDHAPAVRGRLDQAGVEQQLGHPDLRFIRSDAHLLHLVRHLVAGEHLLEGRSASSAAAGLWKRATSSQASRTLTALGCRSPAAIFAFSSRSRPATGR